MKLSVARCVGALAALCATVHAWSVVPSDVHEPADIRGEHEALEKVFDIYSNKPIEKLRVAVPSRVIVSVVHAVGKEEAVNATMNGTEETAARLLAMAANATSTMYAVPSLNGTNTSATAAPLEEIGTILDSAEDDIDGSSSSSSSSSSASSSSSSGSGSYAATSSVVGAHGEASAASEEDSSDFIVAPVNGSEASSSSGNVTSEHVARIVVTGNASELLDLIEVLPWHPTKENGIKIQLKNQNAQVHGYLLTQVVLAQSEQVRKVETDMEAFLTIERDVLIRNRTEEKLKLSATGSGYLFVQDNQSFAVDSMEVAITGDANVVLQMAEVNATDKVEMAIAGSGNVALLATNAVIADELKVKASGAGAVTVQTANLTVEELDTSIAGASIVSLSTNGTCTKQKVDIAGAGVVQSGSIKCARTSVEMMGVGQAIVQTTDKLKTNVGFVGSVEYVGAAPAKVKLTGWYWGSASSYVHPAASNEFITRPVAATPEREPLLVTLELQHSDVSDEPLVQRFTIVSGSADDVLISEAVPVDLTAQLQAQQSHHILNVFATFVVAFAALVATVAAAISFRQRRLRRHYQPLV